jgi:transcriptional regulator with XRE-family HTH domain
MISAKQLHTARLSLNLSVNALAKMAGVAPNSVWNIEDDKDHKASTMLALERALKDEGILFGAKGGVGQRMDWAQGRLSDPQIRAGVLAVLNAARKSRGQAPFVDMEDHQ